MIAATASPRTNFDAPSSPVKVRFPGRLARRRARLPGSRPRSGRRQSPSVARHVNVNRGDFSDTRGRAGDHDELDYRDDEDDHAHIAGVPLTNWLNAITTSPPPPSPVRALEIPAVRVAGSSPRSAPVEKTSRPAATTENREFQRAVYENHRHQHDRRQRQVQHQPEIQHRQRQRIRIAINSAMAAEQRHHPACRGSTVKKRIDATALAIS